MPLREGASRPGPRRSVQRGEHRYGPEPVRFKEILDDPPPRPEQRTIGELAASQESKLKRLLSSNEAEDDSALLSVRQKMYSLVQELRRVLPEDDDEIAPASERRLREILSEDLATAPVETLWLAADSLKLLIPQVADESYVGLLLESESVHERNRAPRRWSNYFPLEELDALLAAYREGSVSRAQHERAVRALVTLWDWRRIDDTEQRARVALKARSFLHYAFLLAGLVLALGVFLYLVDGSLASILTAAAAGALGSTISAARKLHDLVSVEELRALRGWKVLQALLGASAGLFAFMLLSSDVIRLPGTSGSSTSWAVFATYGFIAGFAEPLVLGVVANITKASSFPSNKRR
ncbi:MAG: hypothetical protein M3164_07295 [Actinomycetota bacterium]|nr:hypothetical protein [Actinomycetota bacterium]